MDGLFPFVESLASHWRFLVGLAGATLLQAWPVRGVAWFLLRLPATVLHELAHFVVALVLGARPSRLSFIPQRLADGYRLGAVEFVPSWPTAGLVALAPLFCGIVAMTVAWHIALLQDAFFPGLAFAIAGAAARPSRKDWSIALRYPLSGLVGLALSGALFLAGFGYTSL